MLAVLLAVMAIAAALCALALFAGERQRRPAEHLDEPYRTDGEANGRFVYEVLERVLARTVDGNRYVDTLLLGVLATDVALLVLVLEKTTVFRQHLLMGTITVAGIASAALVLSVFVREAPDPNVFLQETERDLIRTRREFTLLFVALAKRNDRVRGTKRLIFVLALLVMFAASLATTVGTMLELDRNHEAHRTHPPTGATIPPPDRKRSARYPASHT